MKKKIEIDPRDVTGRPATVESVKLQAKVSVDYLRGQGIEVTHSQCLELMARAHGYEDWNTASAMMRRREEFFDKELKLLEEHCGEGYQLEESIYASREKIVGCGWKRISATAKVRAFSSSIISVDPMVSPLFIPKAVNVAGFDSKRTNENRRFMVQAINVGGRPQEFFHWPISKSFKDGLLSDFFSRGNGDPLLVTWDQISARGLARELEIHVYNLNDHEITVSVGVWGTPSYHRIGCPSRREVLLKEKGMDLPVVEACYSRAAGKFD